MIWIITEDKLYFLNLSLFMQVPTEIEFDPDIEEER